MNQRGFIELSLMAWGAIAAAAVIGLLTLALSIQTKRLASCKQEFVTFQAQVKVLGDEALVHKAQIELADQQRKEKADADHAKQLAVLTADIKRLRDARAGGSFVPVAAATASRPELACFDRAELESALRGLDQGVQGLVDQGSATVIDLDTAKRWAQSR